MGRPTPQGPIEPDYNDSAWVTKDLPHDCMSLYVYYVRTHLNGVYDI